MTTPLQLKPSLHPADWARRLAGPILDKELRVASRRRRQYAFRTAYLAVLGLFVVCVWVGIVGRGTRGAWITMHMAQAGQEIVSAVVWFQFIVLPIVSVILLSNSIGEEVRRRTLGVLLATPITAFQIVVGKLGAGLVQVVLLVAISLPLLAVVRVFGGVSWEFVVAGLALTLATSLMAGSLSLYVSIGARRAYSVVLLSLVVLGASLYLVPALISVAVTRSSPSGENALVVFLAHVDPLVSLMVLWISLMYPSSMPVSGLTGWYSACGVATAVSALLVGLSVRKVRRVALRQMSGEGAAEPLAARQTQKGGEQQAGARDLIRPITGSPVAWRELRTHLTTRPVAAGCLCWLAFGLLVLAAFATTYSTGRYSALHPVLLSLLVGAGALATLVAAATGVASEKEAGTWPVLLATPLTAGEILLGKIAGVLRRSAPVWAFPIAYLPIFVLMRGAHPVVVPMIGLVALGMAVFVTGSGLLIGVMVCRATTAVALNLCLAAALWIAAPYLLRTLNDGSRGNEGALALAARVVNPLGTVAMVAEGNPSGGTFGGISNDVASYQWCPRAMCHSAIETLGLIFCVAAVHATAGLGMAIVAGVLIRPRAP